MFCKKCGTKLSDDAKFCANCGVKIQEENSEQMTNNVEGEQGQKENFDEKLIKAYIGNKADKMYNSVKNGGFNIWGFLFGIIYFVYRKMYLVSILTIIISYIIGYIIPSIGNYVGVIIGLMFCPLYKWDITRKLRKIKQENPNTSEEQLLNLAKNKGGTSIIGAVVFFVVYFFGLIFSYCIGGKY